MLKNAFFFLLISIFLFCSCKEKIQTPYARLNGVLKSDQDTIKLAVIGGSITYGSGASEWHNSWANVFKKRLEKQLNKTVLIDNFGIGATSSDFGRYRIQDALKTDPNLVIVEFAVNDSEIDSLSILRNHEQMYLQLFESKSAFMALNLNIENGFTRAPIINQVLENYKIPVVRTQLKTGDFVDGVHPNDKGHEMIAQHLLSYVEGVTEDTKFQATYVKPKELIHPLFKRIERLSLNNWKVENWKLKKESPGYYLEDYSELISEESDTMKIEFYGSDIAIVTLARKFDDPQNGKFNVKIDNGRWVEVNNYWQEPWTKIKTTVIAEDLDEQLHELTLVTIPYMNGNQKIIKQEIVDILISSNSDTVILKD